MSRIPYWIRYRWQELKRRFPIVKRSTLQQEVSRAREAGRREVQDSLTEERKTVQRIIDRLHTIEYRRGDPREYQITLRFQVDLFMGEQDEHRYLARDLAHRVEREIATSKFIRDSNDRYANEGRFHPNMMGDFPR